MAIKCIDGVVVKLGDFGAACRLKEGTLHTTMTGTQAYWPPVSYPLNTLRVISGVADFLQEVKEEALSSGRVTGWSSATDICSLAATLYSLLTFHLPNEKIGEVPISARIAQLKDELPDGRTEASEVLLKLICDCLDRQPARRPIALTLLAVSLKAGSSDGNLRRSESFWTTLAKDSHQAHRQMISQTVRDFSGQYLPLLHATFTSKEICAIMSLTATYSKQSLKTTANRLTEKPKTVFHAAAELTPTDKEFANLVWEVTQWPSSPALEGLVIRSDKDGLYPSQIAAERGSRPICKMLSKIE